MLNESLLKLSKFSCSAGSEGDQHSIDFILPLKFGDTGMSVVALNRFFNTGEDSSTKFGNDLKKRLTEWQVAHAKHISLIAGWVNKNFEGDPSEIPQMEFELGMVGPATFVAIKLASYDGIYKMSQVNEHYAGYIVKKGDYLTKIAKIFGFTLNEVIDANPQISNPNLIRVGEKVFLPSHLLDPIAPASPDVTLQVAIQEAFDYVAGSNAESQSMSPDKDLILNIPLSDVENEPFKDSEYYYCIWNSRKNREQIGSDLDTFIRSSSATALRQAVKHLFGFYSKTTTWQADIRANDGQKFESLIEYQNRTEEGKNVYTLTIEDIPVLEALGISSEGGGESDLDRRVDALAFQDLTEGATAQFASIAKVVMPELSTRSTYKFIISVRASMFDAIPSEIKKPSEHKETEKRNYTSNVCSGEELRDIMSSDSLNLQNFQSAQDRLTNQRQLAKLKQLSSINNSAEIQEQIDQKVRAANLGEMAEFNKRLGDLPFVVLYKVSEFEKNIKLVRELMISYDKVLQETKKYGVMFTPDLSLAEEGERLSSVITPLRKLCDYNDVDLSENNDDMMAISYKVITSGDDQLQGLEIKSVSIIKTSPGVKIFDAGMASFLGSSPISSRTTMVYLALLSALAKEAHKFKAMRAQNLEIDKKEILAFPIAYHFPKPKIDFNPLDADLGEMFGGGLEGFDVSINKVKNYSADIMLKFNMEKNLGIFDKIKLKTLEIENLRDFIVTDVLPVDINFNSLDELFTEFFDRYDLLTMFVDFGQLVPDFEVCDPEWDFDFSIPKLPRLPTFDPIREIVKMLNLAVQDLVMSILSSIVRMILKFLRNNGVTGAEDPLSRVGTRDIFPETTTGGFTELSQKGITGTPGVVNRMRQAGSRLGLPDEAIGELPKVFDTITNVCTPTEISDLLEGVGTPEVNRVVLNTIKSTCSNLAGRVNDPSDVAKIIKAIGDFVNPSVKEKLKNFGFAPPLSDVDTKIPCPEEIGAGNSDKQIRDTLERLNASPKEVERAVSDAQKRRDSIKNFFKKNPLSAHMPGGLNGLAGLPSPYENENMNRLTELAAEGVFGTVETVFNSEVAGFVPLLHQISTRFLNENDPEYDHVGMAEYGYVKAQVDKINRDQNIERRDGGSVPEIIKPGLANFPGMAGREGQYDPREEMSGGPGYLGQGGGTKFVVESISPAKDLENNDLLFNLADKVDAAYFQEIMMRPMKNVKQEMTIFPEFFQYANNPRSSTVNHRQGKGKVYYYLKNLLPTGRLGTDTGTYSYPSKNFNVMMEDQEYINTPADCFRITRSPRIFEKEETELRQTFQYNQPLSEEMQDIISKTFPENDAAYKSLRIDAFAKLVSDSMVYAAEKSTERRFYYGGPNMNIGGISQEGIYNFYNPSDRATTPYTEELVFRRDPVPDANFSSGRARHNAVYDMIIGDINLSEGESTKVEGGYTFLASHFMNMIGNSIRSSRFFSSREMQLLQERMSSKYIEDYSKQDADGRIIRCLIKKKGVLDFEEVRKSALQSYKDSLNREENNPLTRDFSKPGPLEESFADQLIFLYLKTFVVEFALKSIFISSRFSFSHMMQQKFIHDYFVDYLMSTLEKEFDNSKRYKINFYDQIKKIANVEDKTEALNSLVVKMLQNTTEEVEKIIEELFQPKFRSFKHEYFNNLAAQGNIESVPILDQDVNDPGNRDEEAGAANQFVVKPCRNYLSFKNVLRYESDEEGMFNLNTTLGQIRDQELDKNTGYFKLQYYCKIDTPPGREYNYVAKCLGSVRSSEFTTIDGITLYEEGSDDTKFHPDIREWTSFRVNLKKITELYGFAKRIEEYGIVGPSYYTTNQEDPTVYRAGVEYMTPMFLLKNYLKVGVRLVYVTGRHDPAYEKFIFEEGPNSIAEVRSDPLSLYSVAALPDPSDKHYINWEKFLRTDNNVSIGHMRAIVMTKHAITRPLMERMKLGQVHHPESFASANASTGVREDLATNVYNYNLQKGLSGYNTAIELAHHEIKVDCVEDFMESVRLENYARPMESFANKLLEEFVGLGKQPEPDLNNPEGAPRHLDESKIIHPTIKLLFNDIFPLDRLSCLYFINEHGFFDSTERFNDLLGGTRGSIRSTYRVLKNKGTSTAPGEFGIGDKTQVPVGESYEVINANMTSKGPAGAVANDLMGDFAPMIAKLVANAPIIMIRGQAAALDPGYADMDRISKEDPCLLRDGAGIRSLKAPNYTFPNRSIDGGVKDGTYAPVTIAGAVDIGLSVAFLSNPFTFAFGIRGLVNAVNHTMNAISGDSQSKSYGKPLGPVGLLALSLPHLPGESPQRKKREKPCVGHSTGQLSGAMTDAQGNVINGEVTDLQRCDDEEE